MFHSSSVAGALLKTSRAVLEVITATAAAAESQGLGARIPEDQLYVRVRVRAYTCVFAARVCHHPGVFFLHINGHDVDFSISTKQTRGEERNVCQGL